MSPTNFPEANKNYGAPEGVAETQVRTVRAFEGTIARGSCEGWPIVVTAWVPDARELEALNRGEPVFVSFCGGFLPPHFLTTNFAEATNPS